MGLDSIKHFFNELVRSYTHNVDLGDRSVLLTFAAFGTLTVFAIRQLTKKRYNLPPGPKPWPFIGNLLLLRGGTKEMYEVFMDYAEKYGDIFTFYLGPVPVVVLNSPEAVRQTILDKSNDFADRPDTFSTKLFSVTNVSMTGMKATPEWKLQRKIGHAALRKFASGYQLERMLQGRSADVIDLMLKEDGGAFDPMKYLTLLIYNTVGSMVFGRTFELEDEWYVDFTREHSETLEIFSQGFYADAYPILAYLPSPAAQRVKKFMMRFQVFLEKAVQEHRDNFDPDDISDFIYFLLEAEKQAREDPSEDKATLQLLTERHLLGILADIFFAGTDTSRTALYWVIAYCVEHPEVQAKLHKEIDDVIGMDGVIKLSDRERLPYTEAVLHETLRMRPIAPLGLPRATACDTSVRDYTIPKGHHVWVNIWALHKNSDLWKNPHKFDPDRWLDAEGKHMLHPYQFLPFSTGRRVCLGEALAKVQLHLYVAMLFQKLEFRPISGQEGTFKADRLPGFFASAPKPYEVIALPRI